MQYILEPQFSDLEDGSPVGKVFEEIGIRYGVFGIARPNVPFGTGGGIGIPQSTILNPES